IRGIGAADTVTLDARIIVPGGITYVSSGTGQAGKLTYNAPAGTTRILEPSNTAPPGATAYLLDVPGAGVQKVTVQNVTVTNAPLTTLQITGDPTTAHTYTLALDPANKGLLNLSDGTGAPR